MEYISVEEFKKQPQEVQEFLLEWWKRNVRQHDLFYRKLRGERQKYIVVKSEGYELETITLRNRKISAGRDAWTESWNIKCIWDIIPLFTETQLRKFIEEKSKCGLLIYTPDENMESCIQLFNDAGHMHKNHEDLGHDLLKAYWQVACDIAKELINEQEVKS